MAGVKNKEPKYRIFNCLQYEVNPKTGVSLNFDERNIISCIKHSSITRYAYIKHDKDIVTEADIEVGKGVYTEADLGKPKGVHWHIVLHTENHAYPIRTIAKWLGIPENMIDVPKGRGAFIDCVEYLRHSDIHQALKGKYEYNASEVKANFDWELEVERLVLRKTAFERPLSEKEYVKNCVLYKGMTIGEVIDKYPTLYQSEMTIIQKLRTEYINRNAELPDFRVNYYIYGGSGAGKDTMAHALARSLFPDRKYGDDVYFEVGAKKVTFSGYDGQPVIIWSEFRAETFVETLGGYESILGTIDIIPKDKREHRKFGDIRLVNSVNIVTSTQDYKEFLRGLIKEGDPDPTQAHRRFPIIIPIHADTFDIMLNSGYLKSPSFKEYVGWKRVTGSFARLAKELNKRPDAFQKMETHLIEPVIDAHEVVVDSIIHDPYEGKSDDEVVALLKAEGFGEVKTAEEIKQEEQEKARQEYLDKHEANQKLLAEQAKQNAEKREHLLHLFAEWFWFTDDEYMPVEVAYTFAGAIYRNHELYWDIAAQYQYAVDGVSDNELTWLAERFACRIGHGYNGDMIIGYTASELRNAILNAWAGMALYEVGANEVDGNFVVAKELSPFHLSEGDKSILSEARVFAIDGHRNIIKQVFMPVEEVIDVSVNDVDVEKMEPFNPLDFLAKKNSERDAEDEFLER